MYCYYIPIGKYVRVKRGRLLNWFAAQYKFISETAKAGRLLIGLTEQVNIVNEEGRAGKLVRILLLQYNF